MNTRYTRLHPAAWRSLPVVMAAILMLLGGSGCLGAVPSSERSRAAVKRVEPGLTTALSKQGLKLGAPVFIRIFKEPSVLEMWVKKGDTFQLFKTYKICTWSGNLGPKLQEGDNQAPEGCYFVKPSQMNPNSRYHLSFNLGYPNAYDKHHQRTGNALMVHGNCASIGCYAMGDEAIEEIWTLCVRALEGGQPFFRVHCFPFPLTATNLEKYTESRWIGFWRELQPVYEYFEKNRIPPNVEVKDGRYVVDERTR